MTKIYNRERKKYCSGDGIERNIRTILRYSIQEKKDSQLKHKLIIMKKRLHWKKYIEHNNKTRLFPRNIWSFSVNLKDVVL